MTVALVFLVVGASTRRDQSNPNRVVDWMKADSSVPHYI
jgi:hypothetical protein